MLYPPSKRNAQSIWLIALAAVFGLVANPAHGQSLPNTQALNISDDPASLMIDGIDAFLTQQIASIATEQDAFWKDRDLATARKTLASMLGVVDKRMPARLRVPTPVSITPKSPDSETARSQPYAVRPVVWDVLAPPGRPNPAVASIHGEGLMLAPRDQEPRAYVIAIPDADTSPEEYCGMGQSRQGGAPVPEALVRMGYQVVVPTVISRASKPRQGRAVLTDREYLYRPAFELGRQLLGYEIQKVLALVDAFSQSGKPIVVIGHGEGGLLALYSGALDERVTIAASAGYFGPRDQGWQEPLDRNVFGRLRYFSDADLARFYTGRSLLIGNYGYPEISIEGAGGAPALLKPPAPERFAMELALARTHTTIELVSDDQELLAVLGRLVGGTADASGNSETPAAEPSPARQREVGAVANEARYQRQFQEIEVFNEQLLAESGFIRAEFLEDLDTTSLATYRSSVEAYRDQFRTVIGEYDIPLLPPSARTRLFRRSDSWTAHEVQMDVFPNVVASGILLIPNDISEGERRPVVVCQHGLEGRPIDTIEGDHRAYHDFAARLCEQGFVVFAPQNPYIFGDRFRVLQRKSNLIGRSLFSIIVPQHQQIVNWLKTLPFVDAERIGFYGLSYGGKTAMRVPALVTDYCLSICSADFNEWVLKNASTREAFSYVWTGEYEIFEWNLGNTFNYFEMAALICPRPFMVERGHFDGVGVDHWVGFEYAKVRNLYAAQLDIPDRTAIEWFRGPHTINGSGTFQFLREHLNWPER